MTQVMSQYFPYVALLIACSFAVITDVRSRKIPNAIPIALVVTALIFRALHGPWELLSAAATVVVIMLVGLVGFSFRWVGGGDVKFLATASALLPPSEALYFLCFTAIGGGMLALATAACKNTLRQTISGSLAILHGVRTDAGTHIAPLSSTQLPYAIAISFGALSLTLMHTFDPAGLRIF